MCNDYSHLKNGISESAWISHLPWAVTFLQYLNASKSWDGIKIVGERTVKARVAAGSREKDLFYHLVRWVGFEHILWLTDPLKIDEEGHEAVRPTVELCAVDGQVAVIVSKLALLSHDKTAVDIA